MDKVNFSEYIIIKDGTKSWWFFIRKGSIFYKTRNQDGRWTREIKLLDSIATDFSIDIDSKGNLNLICFNKTGELLYLVHNGTHWYNKMLSAFPLEKYKLGNLKIICHGKYINVFFSLGLRKSPGYYSIRHSFWDGSKWSGFKVARTTATKDNEPFYVGYDQRDIVHLVYKASRLGCRQLCYCKFRTDYSLWGNPEKITDIIGIRAYHFALTDNRDALYLLWTEPENNDNKIRYLKRARISYPKGLWENDSLITDGDVDNKQPLLYVVGNTKWTVWVQRGMLVGSFSYDEGKNWTEPVPVDVPLGCRLKLYNIVLSVKEYPEISAGFAYGYEREGDIIIPIIDDILDDKSINRREQTAGININKNKIKKYAIGAKDYIGKLVEEVGRVEEKEKEIEEMVSKQANEISRVYNDLEVFKKEVKGLGEDLARMKNENTEIMASVNDWRDKFKRHQRILEGFTEEYERLFKISETLSERSFIKRILSYFK